MVGRENIEVAEAVRYKPRIIGQIKNTKMVKFRNKNHDSLIHIGSTAQPLFKRGMSINQGYSMKVARIRTCMYIFMYIIHASCMYVHPHPQTGEVLIRGTLPLLTIQPL
jgi:hypothetical protein